MKEEFTSAGSRDFRQRYEQTFGWYTSESQQRILVMLESVSEAGVKFRDSRKNQYTALPDVGNQFEFLSPVKRLFAVKDDIYLIQRRAARQFQRGVSSSNTTIIKLPIGVPVSVNFSNVAAAFTPTVRVGFERKWAAYEEGMRNSMLLSDLFAVCQDNLFLYKEVVGKVDRKAKKIVLTDGTFRQEVADVLRDNGINYSVEVE